MSDDNANGEDLLEFLLHNQSIVEPEINHDTQNQKPVFRNFETVTSGGKTTSRGMVIEHIVEDLGEITHGWPKRIGRMLFIEGEDNRPVELDSATRLFAFLDSVAHVEWSRGIDCVTQERLFAYLQMNAERFESIETSPHFPPHEKTYYMHSEIPESTAGYLEELINFFKPATSLDRDLIHACILTLLWGGPPGTRPAFLITGPDNDPEPNKKGRGIGKSTFVFVLSELVGGMMTFSQREDIAAIKKRLLSPKSKGIRVALLDNLKTLKFSWADLEGLITSPTISGHQMYVGEGHRPNSLVWFLTVNGATLSKDMADRCINIKLGRPEFDPNWEADVRNFIQEYRWQILSEIRSQIES